jgi:ribosomal protein L19E
MMGEDDRRGFAANYQANKDAQVARAEAMRQQLRQLREEAANT